ncbi:hypothetical protein JCM17844_30100 [Iodidimonas gelatinilytica]|uniref:RiboL-PSP-HEPN domain-containing protein n=1 Tax=Iodidimonas gelatinilytica TaxID=1236966 RepID=A0A5A7MVJ7_9PROT|nr:hypothetical protein JCM17844_30100 [Iodidimonas gelatinilytica]
MQNFISHITWDCPECGCFNEQAIEVPELNFTAENISDWTVADIVEIICDGCGFEYFGHVFVYAAGTDFEIEGPHSFSISGEMPMYEPGPEDELYYNPPDDPYSIADEALGHLKGMIGAPSPITDAQFVNRLVFTGAISILEAYLGDTLINAVQSNEAVRTRLLTNYPDLGKEMFSAVELAKEPNAITKRIVAKLKRVLFHNLEVATNLYQSAFGITLEPDKELRDRLFNAMKRRHDCVHRNGCQVDGKKLDDFDDQYVESIIDAIWGVARRVENELLPAAYGGLVCEPQTRGAYLAARGAESAEKQPKRGRLWLNDGSCIRRRPSWRNHVWAYDFVWPARMMAERSVC